MGDSTGYPGDGWTKRDSALWYAEQGYRVGPLHTPVWEHSAVTFDDETPVPPAHWRCSCQARENCRYIGKHPRTMNGLKDFSTSAEVVAGWWDIWPDANIGIATGYPFAFVVDEDVSGALDAGWDVELREVVRATGVVPVMQDTPNGVHYLFSAETPDETVRELGNSTGGRGRSLGPGIDTRGDGGYIVAAPSTTPSGQYRWRSDPRGPWPVLPEPMAEALRPVAYSGTVGSGNLFRGSGESLSSAEEERIARWVTGAVDGAVKDLAGTPRGTRNHALNEHAFRLGTIGAHGALDEEYVRAELAIAWDEAWMHDADVRATGIAPRTWESFAKTFASGWSAGLQRPREPWPPAPAGSELSGVGFAGPLVRLGEAQQTGEVAASAWPAVDWAELFTGEQPPPEWVAGELFERGQQVALVGSGKVGKSLFSQDLAVALVNGRAWLGADHRAPVRVVYFDHENNVRELRRNLESLGHGPADLDGFAYLSFPVTGPLDTVRGAANFLAAVDEHRADVVFLDTVSRVISGAENDADTWLNLYRLALAPLKAAGIAVVRLDHFGKDHSLGARGNSAKNQDVDHVFELTKTSGTGQDVWLRLKRTHSRTGLGREEIVLVRHGEKDDETGWLPGKTSHRIPSVGFVPDKWLVRDELAARADADGIPADASRRAIRTWLSSIGQKMSDDGIRELQEYRQERSRDAGSE